MSSKATAPTDLLKTLRQAGRELCADRPLLTLAFSGGLDSSVVAALAREETEVTALTVGYPQSIDLANASEAARQLDLDWTPIELNDGLLVREAGALLHAFPRLGPLALTFELPLWILLPRAPGRVIFAGQGADELFGGYAKYVDLEGENLRHALDRDLETLLTETVPREREMARLHGKDLRLPYCDLSVVRAVRALPIMVRGGVRRKAALRGIARELGLPVQVVERPKKAAQYGSGITQALRRLARGRGLTLGDFLREDEIRIAP